MKHPVRPQSYMEIRNFYTMTVYEKGAEVVRMQHTLLGEEKFQAGMRLYFQRHDGRAVTCDDFVQAMQDASGIDLKQFKRWYDVAGTPILHCRGSYEDGKFALTVKQSMNPPFHIPFAVKIGEQEQVLSLRQQEEKFVFPVKGKPVPSLLREFSAPVILDYPYGEDDLLHLMAQDDDAFNRWEAGQRLAASIILEKEGKPSAAFIAAARTLLRDPDPAFAAEALTLPSETFLAEQMAVVDPDRLHGSRNALRRALAAALKEDLSRTYESLRSKAPYSPDAQSIGRRSLRNLCLGYLAELGLSKLAYEQFQRADNMTDSMAALATLANLDCPERESALAAFYERWKNEPLVVDKWLAVQAASRLPATLQTVKQLLEHPAFDLKVPNRVYALIRTFAANHVRFHAADGGGHAFLADQILALNALNPQVAARMARSFDRWRRFDETRQSHAKEQLERIRDTEKLSKDVAEIVAKALAA
jgi:aminopeptidase N